MTKIKINEKQNKNSEYDKLGTWFKKDEEILVINLFSQDIKCGEINQWIKTYIISVIKSPRLKGGGHPFDKEFHTSDEAYDFLIEKGYEPIEEVDIHISSRPTVELTKRQRKVGDSSIITEVEEIEVAKVQSLVKSILRKKGYSFGFWDSQLSLGVVKKESVNNLIVGLKVVLASQRDCNVLFNINGKYYILAINFRCGLTDFLLKDLVWFHKTYGINTNSNNQVIGWDK